MAKITIENLKNIVKLDFTLPNPGVYVLTGENGSGKTTLLTCIERLGRGNAFRDFKVSSLPNIDDFDNARITYEHNGNALTYQYDRPNTRWRGYPWGMNYVINALGYNDVKFFRAGSDSSRLYVQSASVVNGQSYRSDYLRAAPNWLRDPLNVIFDTTKFNDLKIRRLANVRGHAALWRESHILIIDPPQLPGQPSRMYTERNFSMGELFLINLLYELHHIGQDELLVIDEIELALHPKAQLMFLQHLEQLAAQYNLTVILSTHSSTLIRRAKQLLFLEPIGNGHITVHPDYHPAYALGVISDESDIIPDKIFAVEDDKAVLFLQAFMNLHARLNRLSRRPFVPVLPIGGYKEVVKFALRARGAMINNNVPVIAFPDGDVQTDSLPYLQQYGGINNEFLLNIQALNAGGVSYLHYLPCTPEIGFCLHFEANLNVYTNWLQQRYNTPLLNATNVFNGADYQQAHNAIGVEQNAIVALSAQTAAAVGTANHAALSRQLMQLM